MAENKVVALNLGPVTSYGLAKSKGFPGTEEAWVEKMMATATDDDVDALDEKIDDLDTKVDTQVETINATIEQEVGAVDTKADGIAANLTTLSGVVAQKMDTTVAQASFVPVPSASGAQGDALRNNGDGTTAWAPIGLPTDEQTGTAINAWLTAHPEATTTVQDGAITRAKLITDLQEKTDLAQNATAPAFDATVAYAAGAHVTYGGKLYVLPSGHEANVTWADTTKTEVNLGGEVADLKSAIIPVNNYNTVLLTENTDLFQLDVGVYTTNSTALTNTIINKPESVKAPFRAIVSNISNSLRKYIILITTAQHIYFTTQGSQGFYTWKELATVESLTNAIATVNDNISKVETEETNKFAFENSLKTSTINLLNPNTITTGYILVNNEPTEMNNYWYSDYIFIGGNTIYYRDHGASIASLVSCYDKERQYLGKVDYTSEEGYERITGTYPTNYYKITPLDGTAYIRVNGRYTSNLMLCPYFYPEKYVEYNKIYYKGALKIAMFGDSITLGTNGNDHSNPAVQNLPYWVEKITGCIVDNHGVGGMGWVSTQYLSEIAYDKISSVDLTGYDVITLCYGVNDTGAVLGEYNSTDETTIMGQINKCVKYIGAQNPKARIIIIAPWNGASSNAAFPAWGYGRTVYFAATGDTSRSKTRQDLCNAERELCDVYGCGFIGQDDSPLNGFGLGTADSVTPGPYIGADLVHPSLDGYKAMGEWLAAKISGIVAFK